MNTDTLAAATPGVAATPALPDLTGLENVALGKPATQSSLYRPRRVNDAMGAVNGIKTGSFGFHTGVDPEPWWRLDLLAPTPVRFVVLWNREDARPERVRHLVVETSLDGDAWSVLHETGETTFGGVRSGTPLVIAGHDRPFRFLRLRRTEPGHLHLDEVEVYSPDNAEQRAERAAQMLRALRVELGDEAEISHRFVKDALAIRWPGPEAGRPRTMSLRRLGRFGNNFIQLIQAIHVARLLGIGRIHLVGVNPAGLAAPREIGGIEFVPEPTDGRDGPDLHGRFFYRGALPRCYERLGAADTISIIETYLRPMFDGFHGERPAAAGPALHIHIRSGDVFADLQPHRRYTQPPLAFYALAVRHAVQAWGVRQVVVVHEDEANPCVASLRAWLEAEGIAWRLQSASLREDVGELMAAEHLVTSRGTFCIPAMLLSTRLRTVFGFRRDAVATVQDLPTAALLARRGIRLLNVEDAAAAYIPDDGWKNTPEQRAMMLDYPEASLRLVEAGEDRTHP